LTLDVGDASDLFDIFAVCCGALSIRRAGCQRDRIVSGLKIRRSHFIGEPVWDSRDNSGRFLVYVSRCDRLASGWHRVSDFALADLVGLTRLFQHSAFKNGSEGDDSSR
jgi:hypothetical protein